jgi:hypothetical protein
MLHAKMWAVIGSSFATGGVWDVRSRGMGGRGVGYRLEEREAVWRAVWAGAVLGGGWGAKMGILRW